jgi:hypothetical protein
MVIVFAMPTTLTAQSLSSIDPNTAQQGESLGVAITGQDTHFDQAATMSIWFSQGGSTISAYGYYPVDDTFMTVWFDIPTDAAIGLHDLNVYDDIDGSLTLTDSFTIVPFTQPELVSVEPNTVQQGQQLSVAISGQGTHFKQGTGTATDGTQVWFGQASMTTTVFAVSDTLLFAVVETPEDAPTGGMQDLTVYNDIDGTLTLYDSVQITPYNPMITSVTPKGAYQGQNLSVRIVSSQDIAPFWEDSITAAWLSQGTSLIVAKVGMPLQGTWLGRYAYRASVGEFLIPEDANSGYWDVHIYGENVGHLTLEDGFIIVQPGDWTSDGVVNFRDLAVIGEHWLEGPGP